MRASNMTSAVHRYGRNAIAALLGAACMLTVICVAGCSKSAAPQGPVPDVTVGPGLSVIIDSSDFITVSVATLKGKEATPTYSGRLRGGGGTNPAGEKPADADVRLRFVVFN